MSSDLEAAAEHIRRGGPDRSVWETVYGQSFLSVPLTPFLARALRRVEEALTVASRHAGAQVEIMSPLVVAERNLVVPDVVVRDPAGSIALVVELRSESTERYALGMKRLVYSMAAIPEFWFVEPRERNLHRLELIDRFDGYGWPPQLLRDGDTVGVPGLPGASIAVSDALPLPARWMPLGDIATNGHPLSDPPVLRAPMTTPDHMADAASGEPHG